MRWSSADGRLSVGKVERPAAQGYRLLSAKLQIYRMPKPCFRPTSRLCPTRKARPTSSPTRPPRNPVCCIPVSSLTRSLKAAPSAASPLAADAPTRPRSPRSAAPSLTARCWEGTSPPPRSCLPRLRGVPSSSPRSRWGPSSSAPTARSACPRTFFYCTFHFFYKKSSSCMLRTQLYSTFVIQFN